MKVNPVVGTTIMPMSVLRDVHVVPQGLMWSVVEEGNATRLLTARTQLEAIAYGMSLARQGANLLVIHGRNGQFRQVWNYKDIAPDLVGK